MKRVVRILIPLLAFLVPFAHAQDKEKKYRFEFFGGASRPFDKNFEFGFPQTAVAVKAKHKFSYGAQGGVRFGIDGARYWGQDYAYSYGANASRFVTPFGRFSFQNRFHQVSSNVLFYPWSLNRRQAFPYLTAGVGATFLTLAQSTIAQSGNPFQAIVGPLKSETFFAFNAGLGVRIRLSERFGLRFDGRDYMSRALRYGLPKSSNDADAPVLPVSGVFHQFAGTVSIIVHF